MAMALGNITPYSRLCAPDGKAVAKTRQPLPLQDDQPSMIHGESAIASETAVRAGLSANLAKLWRYGLVLSRQRDVADDLVQQTCVRALERAQQFSDGTRLDHWLLSILHSIWLNELRSRRVRFGQGQIEAEEVLAFDGAEIADRKMEALQVMKRVNDLPEAQRMAVFLAYVEGFSYREVATVLDIPIGTVMSRLAAARAKLAEGGV